MRRLAFAAASLGLCAGTAQALPFAVHAGGRDEVTTGLAAAERLSCRFAYDASSSDSPAVDSKEATKAAELLSSVAGECVSKIAGTFTYEVCLGSAVRQRGVGGPQDEGMLVGKLASQPGTKGVAALNVLRYADGDKCGDRPRSAEVTLYCGTAFSVLRADEPDTCFYTFDIAHPTLCELQSVFPTRSVVQPDAEASTTAALPPSDPLSALPPWVLRRLAGSEAVLRDGLVAWRESEGSHAAGASSLTEADVAGVGGKTIGLDDRERHGGRWTGLASGAPGKDARATWHLDLHADWPHASDAARSQWTCAAIATDELRHGTGPTAQPAVPLRAAVLTVGLPPDVAQGRVRLVAAAARDADRRPLDVVVEATQGDKELSVAVRLRPAGAAGEGAGAPPAPATGAGVAVPSVADVAFVSLTVELREE